MNHLTTITIDIARPLPLVVVHAKQNDSARSIAVKLIDNGVAYSVPNGVTPIFRAGKPDGTGIFTDDDITVDGSTVTVLLPEQALTVAGTVSAEINLYNADGEKLTSFAWRIDVEKSVIADSTIISSSYFNALTALAQDILAHNILTVDGVSPDASGNVALYAARQYTTMPVTATAGDVVQYTGATTGGYINGHFYRWSGSAWAEIVFGDPNSVSYDAQGKTDAQKTQARTNIGAADVAAFSAHYTNGVVDGLGLGTPATGSGNVDVADSLTDPLRNVVVGAPNYEYSGRDLSQIYTAAELHAKVVAGDFSGVRIGDYWPITLSGTYHDYAESADKTLSSAVVILEVAGIDTFYQYSDTAVPHHLVMVSRDCLPNTMKMRSADTTWYNATATNPWLGSAAYETFNNETNGLIKLVAATPIGAYIYAGANAKGMRFLGETKASGATAAISWDWLDRGKLWLPTEREVWGQDAWSEHGFGGGAPIQHPIFQGGLRHIIKGLGNGGSRYGWWCSSSNSGSAASFCYVNNYGTASYRGASGAAGVPLCFLLS